MGSTKQGNGRGQGKTMVPADTPGVGLHTPAGEEGR